MTLQIPKSSKNYFVEMYKYKFLQELEREGERIHDTLMSNDAHCQDKEYVQYLKNQYLATTFMAHQIAKIYDAKEW